MNGADESLLIKQIEQAREEAGSPPTESKPRPMPKSAWPPKKPETEQQAQERMLKLAVRTKARAEIAAKLAVAYLTRFGLGPDGSFKPGAAKAVQWADELLAELDKPDA